MVGEPKGKNAVRRVARNWKINEKTRLTEQRGQPTLAPLSIGLKRQVERKVEDKVSYEGAGSIKGMDTKLRLLFDQVLCNLSCQNDSREKAARLVILDERQLLPKAVE